PVRGYSKQLEIVFINLMKNALQAMHTFKRDVHVLTLGSQEQNGSVGISVKDTGPGIATKDLPYIFDAHFTTKGHKGTGMGLYLTNQIVKTHGGTLEVLSEVGQGTEFIVKLPRWAEQKGAA